MGTWGVIIPPYQHWLPSDLRFSSLTAKLSQKPRLQAAALAGWALAVYSISAGVSWSDRAAAFGRSTAGKDVVATLFFLVWEPELNIWLLCLCGVCVSVCLCVCVCGVPWMDGMLWSVREERQMYSHKQCEQYMCTHSHGHNSIMNKARILAQASTLHCSQTIRLRLALFPPFPVTHPVTWPPMTVVSIEVKIKTSSRLLQDCFQTISIQLRLSGHISILIQPPTHPK